MQVKTDFLKRLKNLNPALGIEFHEGRQRWRVTMDTQAPGRNGEKSNVPPFNAVPSVKYDGNLIMRLKPTRFTVMWITDKDGGYAEPGQEVITVLRESDTWKQATGTHDRLVRDEERTKQLSDLELAENTDDIVKTAVDMRMKVQFDLGSIRPGEANAI